MICPGNELRVRAESRAYEPLRGSGGPEGNSIVNYRTGKRKRGRQNFAKRMNLTERHLLPSALSEDQPVRRHSSPAPQSSRGRQLFVRRERVRATENAAPSFGGADETTE